MHELNGFLIVDKFELIIAIVFFLIVIISNAYFAIFNSICSSQFESISLDFNIYNLSFVNLLKPAKDFK